MTLPMDQPRDATNQQAASMATTNSLQQCNREELKSLLQKVKSLKTKCLRNTLILESVEECLNRAEKHRTSAGNRNVLPSVVADKVAKVLCVERLCGGSASVTESGEHVDDGSFNILGLSCDFLTSRGTGLPGIEKQLVRTAVEQHLLEKQRCHLPKKFITEKAGGSHEIGQGTITEHGIYDLVLHNDTILHDHWAELKQLLEMRQHVVQEILSGKVACLKSQLEMCHAKKRCVDAGLLDIILKEVSRYPKALKVVYVQMREDRYKLVSEIDRMKNLLEAYQRLKGTKFDVLLLNYKTIVKELEHVKWALHSLK